MNIFFLTRLIMVIILFVSKLLRLLVVKLGNKIGCWRHWRYALRQMLNNIPNWKIKSQNKSYNKIILFMSLTWNRNWLCLIKSLKLSVVQRQHEVWRRTWLENGQTMPYVTDGGQHRVYWASPSSRNKVSSIHFRNMKGWKIQSVFPQLFCLLLLSLMLPHMKL